MLVPYARGGHRAETNLWLYGPTETGFLCAYAAYLTLVGYAYFARFPEQKKVEVPGAHRRAVEEGADLFTPSKVYDEARDGT